MNFKISVLLIVGTWIGLVFGISFIEAPLKFTAPGITTELGVGIGKVVFGLSNKIQLLFLTLLIAVLAFKKIEILDSFIKIGFILLGLMLIQTFYFFPLLDDRANRLIAGELVEKSWHHVGFVFCEVIKLISLITLFVKIEKHA